MTEKQIETVAGAIEHLEDALDRMSKNEAIQLETKVVIVHAIGMLEGLIGISEEVEDEVSTVDNSRE